MIGFDGRKRMFVTDLDGTLLRSDRTFSRGDLAALEILGETDTLRVVATGRSAYAFDRVGGRALPVDLVIFSSGAGIFRQGDGTLLRECNLGAEAVHRAMAVLEAAGVDFSVHGPVPESHLFVYRRFGRDNPDFDRRLSLYDGFCRPMGSSAGVSGPAGQLLGIAPGANRIDLFDRIRGALPDLNVVRSTSPLDGVSTWIEIFHPDASKPLASAWAAAQLGIGVERVCAVGNDYNDEDLLAWAGKAFVTENAPEDLKARFFQVSSNDFGGVAEAVARWQGTGPLHRCGRIDAGPGAACEKEDRNDGSGHDA